MPRGLLSTTACLALAASLGACGTSRFDSPRPRPQAALEPATPALPSGRVTSEPLAPPPGASAAPVDAPPSVAAAPSPALEPEPLPPPPAPAPVVATGRSSVVGSWNATDATGSCKVSLSSAPALDLYKASTSGCANKDLAKVSAWDFRDGEVYLYQPGGTVTARLRQSGGSLDGALSKSGAQLALAR
ncbi:AprI/Inh family metalloprotease inhibitor [Methylorubrum salsuginis]|uniref:Protease inhibitor Inh n=1 Tax=Methylorubrum salsuginis TaxID=414703 RepID=A0A1I4F1N7_9HYPH|nr:AprI/Inh family metalloprotease inhibitor [Methylorubrum salsuginis]SFL11878.1 Protease inhibitor Inh [Methylorubrum salsuginis]